MTEEKRLPGPIPQDGYKSRKFLATIGFGASGIAVMAVGFFMGKVTGPEMSSFFVMYIPLVLGVYTGGNVWEKKAK